MTLFGLLILMSAGVPIMISLLKAKSAGTFALLIGLVIGSLIGISCSWLLHIAGKYAGEWLRLRQERCSSKTELAYGLLYLIAFVWVVVSGILSFYFAELGIRLIR